jgi:hypothetical protein
MSIGISPDLDADTVVTTGANIEWKISSSLADSSINDVIAGAIEEGVGGWCIWTGGI